MSTDLLLLRCFRRLHVSGWCSGIVQGPRQVPADGRLDGAEKTLQPVLEFGALLLVCMPNQNRQNPVRTRASKTKTRDKRVRARMGRDGGHTQHAPDEWLHDHFISARVFVYVHLVNKTLNSKSSSIAWGKAVVFWHSRCLSARWVTQSYCFFLFGAICDSDNEQVLGHTHTRDCVYQMSSLRLVDFPVSSWDVFHDRE